MNVKWALLAIAATASALAAGYFLRVICLPFEGCAFLAIMPMAFSTYRYSDTLNVREYSEKWHVFPICFYLIVVGILIIREGLIIFTRAVPCGLCEYRNVCVQRDDGERCVTWNATLTSCFPDEQTEMPELLVMASVGPAVVTLAVTVSLLVKFHFSTTYSRVMLPDLAIILVIPVTYAACSLSGLRNLSENESDLWSPKLLLDVCDLYTAAGLYAFKNLMLKCTQPGHGNIEPALWAMGCALMALGLLPYVGVCVVLNLCEIFVKEVIFFWYPESCFDALPKVISFIFPALQNAEFNPEKTFTSYHNHQGSSACHEVWGAFDPMLTFMNFVVCTIAVTCIVFYEHSMGSLLSRMESPVLKFWGVKGLLLIAFWQNIILPQVIPQKVLLAKYNSALMCWEACGLALFHIVAYHPDHFKNVVEEQIEEPGEQSTAGRVLQGVTDMAADAMAWVPAVPAMPAMPKPWQVPMPWEEVSDADVANPRQQDAGQAHIGFLGADHKTEGEFPAMEPSYPADRSCCALQ